jgi:Uma2 family endonuclease
MNTAVTTIPTPTAHHPLHESDTVADLLDKLGGISPDRIRLTPPPGTVTFEQFVESNEQRTGVVCEWLENSLVEKAMGQRESSVAFIIGGMMYAYMLDHDVGMFLGADGVLKILPGIGRAPDISFISWERLPGGKPPPRSDKVPAIAPDLAVEVLSARNTSREMARKRDEYFRAGVRLVWEIDPETRTANVYTGTDQVQAIPEEGTLDGSNVLPGFSLSLKAVFDHAERRM